MWRPHQVSKRNTVLAILPPFLHKQLARVEASPLRYRLVKGAFWSLAGALISRSLMLTATVLVARMLGKTIFGEFGMIQSTIGMFGVFAGFGLGLTATKHVAEFRQTDPERTGRIIGLSGLFAMLTGGLMALGLFIFASWLAESTINASHLAGVLRIGALILFINALNGAQTGTLSGFEAFKTIAYINLFAGLISFPILVGGAYIGSLTGTVWALAITLVINWLLNHLALRKEARRYHVPLTFYNCRREISILWRFSLPAVLSSAMVGPIYWVCQALLANQPYGYREMGTLTAALVFQRLLLFVSDTLTSPLLSIISNAGPKISDKLGIVNILSSWILGVVACLPLLCFPEIAKIIFGSAYNTKSFTVTFSIIVFCTSIMTFKAGLARVLIANNLLWWGFFSNALWAFILIVSAIFFVRWGAPGLAASFAIAYIFNTLILVPLYYSRKLVPKGTLLSIESALIWFIIVVLVFLNIANVPLLVRTIAFLPSLILTGIAFTRLMRGVNTQDETIVLQSVGGLEYEP